MAEQTAERQGRIDYLIDQMFDVLPAATTAEIAEKLSRKTRSTVTTGMVSALLSHLRRNAESYGWTVPHVKRGVNADGGKRYFAALIEPDGSLYLDETPESRVFLKDGLVSTVGHAGTMLRNEAAALIAGSKMTRSRNLRAKIAEWSEDIAYIGRRAARILVELREDESIAA
jgi:hypothetical protein